LILHEKVDRSVAHSILACVAVNTSHAFFVMDVGDEIPDESPVRKGRIVETAVDKRCSILGAFHLPLIAQTDSRASVMASSATVIGNAVRDGMCGRMAGFVAVYGWVSSFISALFTAWGMTRRTPSKAAELAAALGCSQVASCAKFSEMTVHEAENSPKVYLLRDFPQMGLSVRSLLHCKLGATIIRQSPLETEYSDYPRVGGHERSLHIFCPVQEVVFALGMASTGGLCCIAATRVCKIQRRRIAPPSQPSMGSVHG